MTTAAAAPSASAAAGQAPVSAGWALALGLLLIIAGVAALLFPVVAAVTAALYVGWLAIVAGVIAISVAFRTRGDAHFAWRFAVGLVYVLLGLLLVVNPIAGAASLAILVGALMAASGVVEITLALRLKPHRGWGWLFANGVLSIALAIFIAIGWPVGSLLMIGYFVGFQMIMCGVARIALSMGARAPAVT